MARIPKFTRARQSHPLVQHALIALAVIFGLWPGEVLGLGDRIPNQDAEAIGRGNAFAATADNPSALYYNPAGITQLQGNNIQFGSLVYLGIYTEYQSPSGQTFDNKHKILTVPQVDYVFTPKDSAFSFGLGVHAPFGLGMEWPDDVPFRGAGIKAQVTHITIDPVVAWKPFPTLSIAAGPTFSYAELELIQGVAMSPYQFRFKGHDWAFGATAGILWQPHPMWSFGAKYFSPTPVDFKGGASFDPAAPFLPPGSQTEAHIKTPQMASGGISFRPTPKWNIEFDVDWTDWDMTKSLAIDQIGTLPLNWESSFFYEFGITRKFGNGYYASVGYFFSGKSTPERYYTPLVPDINLHIGSFGIGHKGEHWNWAFAFQMIGGGYREIQGNVNPIVDGQYKLWTPTISGSVGYHF
jgi:long-chain fatty acid transport protein